MNIKNQLLAAAFILGGISSSFAQTEISVDDTRQVRFGIKTGGNIGWVKSQSQQLEPDGAGLGFKLGAMLDFRLANSANYAFSTGAGISSVAAKVSYPEYFQGQGPNGTTINYSGRQQSAFRINYIDIPLLFKGKTNEIGYLTYFMQIGAGLGVRYRANATETNQGLIVNDLTGVDPNAAAESFGEKEVDIQDETQFMRVSFVVGGGVEYNLAGNTNLYAAINFNNGLINAFNNNNKSENQTLSGVEFEDTGIYEENANGNAKLNDGSNSTLPLNAPLNAGSFDGRLNYITLDIGIFF